MDGAQVIPEEIQVLLDQRGTFQEWLSRLSELGSEFRAEVADKVRADYEERLRKVEGQLEGHRTELESTLEARRSAVADVAGRHDARAAELEESQLRYRVGEYDDAEWEQRRDEHEAELAELSGELSTQRDAVAALEVVLAELAGTEPDRAAVVALPAVEAAVAEESQGEPPGPVEAPDAASAADEPWMKQPFAEREAEETDEGAVSTGDLPPAEPELAPRSGEAQAEEPADEFMDELEFLESLSLDETDNFDAVSAMLDDEAEAGTTPDEADPEGKTEDL